MTELEQIPNIGPKIAQQLQRLGIGHPRELKRRDPYRLYDALCRLDSRRVDPCVLDVFISAVSYVNGGPAKPWWTFTPERKRRLELSAQ